MTLNFCPYQSQKNIVVNDAPYFNEVIIFLKRLVKQILGLIILFCLPIILWRHRRQVLILSYHRILPKSHPEYKQMQPGMVISEDTFRNHILWLTKYLKIIRLCEISNYRNQNITPACVITLDDGWADNYQYAFPILKELNTVATIFLVSSMIDTERYFWPEKLGLLLANKNSKKILNTYLQTKYATQMSGVEDYDELIEILKDKSDEDIIKILNDVEKEVGDVSESYKPSRQVLNQDELHEMRTSDLVEFGSHTANHIRLDKISTPTVVDELTYSKQQLEDLTGQNITTFCYPNGSYTDDVVKLVSDVYELACTTDEGWVDAKVDMHKLKRVMLHDDASNSKSLFWGRVLGFF